MTASIAPVVTGLPPVIPAACRLLVLGSLPGNRSLAARQYYAHPQNQFWRLMGMVTGESLSGLPYDSRLAALDRHKIGLWDVIATARRASSLDGDIQQAVSNPLASLITNLPGLRAVACNGALAAKLATRQLGGQLGRQADASAVPLLALPSSSPANTQAFAAKAELWQALREFLALPTEG